MPRYLLDTNILISLIKGEAAAEAIIRHADRFDEADLCISAITLYELEVGALKHGQRAALDAILASMAMPVLDFDAAAAKEAAQIRYEVEQSGMVWPRSGVADLLIAAQARSKALILVTNNETDFQAVQRLVVENWAKF